MRVFRCSLGLFRSHSDVTSPCALHLHELRASGRARDLDENLFSVDRDEVALDLKVGPDACAADYEAGCAERISEETLNQLSDAGIALCPGSLLGLRLDLRD